jgi:hypothetical protein
MLTFSDAQIAAMAVALENDFIDRLAVAMREALPEETRDFTDLALRVFVIRGVEDARSFELSQEGPIADFVGLALQFGPAFHYHARVSSILTDWERPEEERLAALLSDLTEDEWAEIESYGAMMQDEE